MSDLVVHLLVPEIRERLNYTMKINLGWSLVQIIVALLHICVICVNGMKTNEETRNILTAVLAIVPDKDADLDRFQISSFVHKMSTQYMWGMTVWRAFPLERSTFFTIISVSVTYSIVLLKIQENQNFSPSRFNANGVQNVTEIFNFSNSTEGVKCFF